MNMAVLIIVAVILAVQVAQSVIVYRKYQDDTDSIVWALGEFREQLLKRFNNLSEELDVTDEINRDLAAEIREGIQAAVEELYGRINLLDESFKAESAELKEHTESLKAHGKALLDREHIASTVTRQVVRR